MEKKLKQYIDLEILPYLVGSTHLVLMDFDECAVSGHLSRMITEMCPVSTKNSQEVEAAKHDSSRKSLYTLSRVFLGMQETEYSKVITACAEKVKWRNGVKQFLDSVKDDHSVRFIWVSSGIYEAIVYKQRHLKNKPLVIASRSISKEDKICGTSFVVTDKDKGEVVRYLRNVLSGRKIMTIGHSKGDRYLVENGDIGLRIAFNDKSAPIEEADFIVNKWAWKALVPFIKSM